jgi:hypothetical protein
MRWAWVERHPILSPLLRPLVPDEHEIDLLLEAVHLVDLHDEIVAEANDAARVTARELRVAGSKMKKSSGIAESGTTPLRPRSGTSTKKPKFRTSVTSAA